MAYYQWNNTGDRNLIRFSKLNLVLVVFTLVGLLALSPSLANPASATHLSDEFTWQLVVLSSYPACSNYHYQILNKYDEITEKYFELYQFANEKHEPKCFPITDYLDYYSSPDDLDMLIIVLDSNLGQEELHKRKMGGLYTHSGTGKLSNHAIIMCDCPNFYYSDPVWILTHELSHFLLYYLEYDYSIIEGLVHSYDEKYDQCRQSYTEDCVDVINKLRVDDMSYSFNVMPPYEQAIGANALMNEKNISSNIIELNKVIVKWWLDGKINEADYSNVLGFLKPEESFENNDNTKVLFKDDPLDKNIVMWYDVLDPKPIIDTEELLAKIPNFLKSDAERVFKDVDISGLPAWFKETAQWWVEGKITDKEFIQNVEYLQNSGVIRPH